MAPFLYKNHRLLGQNLSKYAYRSVDINIFYRPVMICKKFKVGRVGTPKTQPIHHSNPTAYPPLILGCDAVDNGGTEDMNAYINLMTLKSIILQPLIFVCSWQ